MKRQVNHGNQSLSGKLRRYDKTGRPLTGDEEIYNMGRLTVDCGRCAVSISGAFVALTRNEYTIVELLSRAEGRVITNECMLSALWGSTDSKRHCQLRVHIYNIRHKLAIPQNSPGYICTINGIGYRMDL